MPNLSLTEGWIVALALLVVCLLAYAVVGLQTGLYWDDWWILYFIRHFDPAIFWEAFAEDRPLRGSNYQLAATMLGDSLRAWQVFAILMRWTSCLTVWWLLQLLWPRHPRRNSAIAFLFAVYPGFQQQSVAITYSLFHLEHSLFYLSLGMTLATLRWSLNGAAQGRRWFWLLYLASIPIAGYVLFLQEYTTGLELLRPALIWLVLTDLPEYTDLTVSKWVKPLHRTLTLWSPFLAMVGAFLVYRIATPTPRGKIILIDQFLQGPLAAAWDLLKLAASDMYETTLQAWAQVVRWSTLASYPSALILRYSLIVLGAAMATAIALICCRKQEERSIQVGFWAARRQALQVAGLGILFLLAGGIPFWSAGLPIMLHFPRDRFTLPMMLGASILGAGLVELVSWRRWQFILISALLTGLGAGLQYRIGLSYLEDWRLQKDFFWQLTWRAPAIQPGTVFLTADAPFPYNSDNSLAAAVNWTYAPDNDGRQMAYFLYNVESHLSRGLPDLSPDMPIRQSARLTYFEGSVAQALTIYYNPPACLRLLNPLTDQTTPDKPRYFRELLPLSRPELIIKGRQGGATPPTALFGSEPEHGWCYYYQKAELARQEQDWQTAAAMADQALLLKEKFYRKRVAELTPFIEGYAHTGQWEKAISLTEQAIETWAGMDRMLCDSWRRVARTTLPTAQSTIVLEQAQSLLGCKVK